MKWAVSLLEQAPRLVPPLDRDFRPAALGDRAFGEHVRALGGGPTLSVALERDGGQVVAHSVELSPRAEDLELNRRYSERLLKFLLWQSGGGRVYCAGPEAVTGFLAAAYRPRGLREFDADFMRAVYQQSSFEVVVVRPSELPRARENEKRVSHALTGCRIGFDAGGSDRKVTALVDGEVVFADETVWHPKLESDPAYHFDGIMDSLQRARQYLPRLDALGVSSAGIYVDNEVRIASLFRKVPAPAFERRIRRIYLDVAAELGAPVAVANDGDVAALAGAMSLGEAPVLGLALGTSLAAGYVSASGAITGRLNELAFAPLDYAAGAPRDDEWSGDQGVGVNYLSQDAAIRLAGRAGFALDPAASPAEKLVALQRKVRANDPGARAIFETLGVYLGYAVLKYSQFYALKHVLLMGRVLSGVGGDVVSATAKEVLEQEAPELSRTVRLQLPDESARRIGQSFAAATLVEL